MEDSLSSSSILRSNPTIENNYKLALKLFINKNFDKSYGLTNRLYHQSFSDFQSGSITEKLFVKIISLYLVSTGVAVTQPELAPEEKRSLVKAFKNDDIIKRLLQVYQAEYEIPYEILYNYYLNIISNKSVFLKDDNAIESFVQKLGKLYSTIDYTQTNKYLRKLVDLYTFEVLPTFEKFDHAEVIIRENQLYSSEVNENLSKLKQIKEAKAENLKHEQAKLKEKQRLEKEAKQKELQKQRELKESQNLNYKSIKDIQKQYSEERPSTFSKASPSTTSTSEQLDQAKRQILYLYRISKNFLRENSVVIIILLVAAFTTSRLVNLRKIKIKDTIRDTVKMAFKISYL